jgi:hypothetical protein
MIVVTDNESKIVKTNPYVDWKTEWEWDFENVVVWSPHILYPPRHVKIAEVPEMANVFVGALVTDEVGFKRVEVFELVVYYLKPNQSNPLRDIILSRRGGY